MNSLADSRPELASQPQGPLYGTVHGNGGQAILHSQRPRKRRLPGKRRARYHDIVGLPFLPRRRHLVPLRNGTATRAASALQGLRRCLQPILVAVSSGGRCGGFTAVDADAAALALLVAAAVIVAVLAILFAELAGFLLCSCCCCSCCCSCCCCAWRGAVGQLTATGGASASCAVRTRARCPPGFVVDARDVGTVSGTSLSSGGGGGSGLSSTAACLFCFPSLLARLCFVLSTGDVDERLVQPLSREPRGQAEDLVCGEAGRSGQDLLFY